MSQEKWEQFLEAECDGSGPHALFEADGPETRRLPTGGAGAVLLCYACYRREIRWRIERNRELSPENAFKLPEWKSLPTYATMAAPNQTDSIANCSDCFAGAKAAPRLPNGRMRMVLCSKHAPEVRS